MKSEIDVILVGGSDVRGSPCPSARCGDEPPLSPLLRALSSSKLM